MKRLLFTLMLCMGWLIFVGNLPAQCPGGRLDLNDDLSPAQREELKDLIMAYLNLGKIPANPPLTRYPNVSHHNAHLNQVHGTCTDAFVTWHRYYLQELEHYLLSQGATQFVPLPRWDPENCIPDEFFGSDAWLTDLGAVNNDCINPPSFSAFRNINCNNFDDADDFACQLENPHNNVHVLLGGMMGNAGIAPGASIFWPWHAWIDDLWKCYQDECLELTSDLYVRDEVADDGDEPSNANINWLSPDIWVRQTNDGFQNQVSQDLFQTPGADGYVYIRVWNRGEGRHPEGQGTIEAYWANASAGLNWPSPWDGEPIIGLCEPPNQDLPLGGLISTQVLRSVNETFIDFTHNNIARPDYTIYEFEWELPDPDRYKSCFDVEEWHHRHFCILARIIDDDNDPIVQNGDFRAYLNDNNDVALKNITIYGDGQQVSPDDQECLFFGNYTTQTMANVGLRVVFPTAADAELLNVAALRITLDDAAQTEWDANNRLGTDVTYDQGAIRFNAQNANLTGLSFEAFEIHQFCLEIEQLVQVDQTFAFDIIQYNGNQLVNGERYEVGLRTEQQGRPPNPPTLNSSTSDPMLSFTMLPNPSTDQIVLSWADIANEKVIEIADPSGRILISSKGNGGQAFIDLKAVPKGIYFVRLTDKLNNKTNAQKLVVE
ncbi:MAG: tyrosinase family protein [Saprospiraceae bacterium]